MNYKYLSDKNLLIFGRCGCCGNALAGCAHVYIAGYDGTHSGFGDLLFMIQYMKSSLPLEIIEAVRIDSRGEFKTFNRIIIPIMKSAFAVQAIFPFVASRNNFFMPQIILSTKDKYTILWYLR